jgi:hypothetical protein
VAGHTQDVFSRTLDRARLEHYCVRDVVAEEVMGLKAQPGGDMVLGGADIAAAFMRHDLTDAYRLCIHPIGIGQGKACSGHRTPGSIPGSPKPGHSGTGSSFTAISKPVLTQGTRVPLGSNCGPTLAASGVESKLS